MATKTKRGGKARDTYFKLVREFPLRPLRSDDELGRAIEVIDRLLDRDDLDEDEQDYLDVLGDLVHRYESTEHPMPAVTDAEMLCHLLQAKEVKQAEVAKRTGIAESTISEVLAGKRALNRSHINKLAKYFQVSPAVFPFGA